MFPFWDDVIAPVIEAVGARRVVEIGALRGETTVRMFDRLGPDCELHVIDPLPQFDPAEHETAFPGRYFFHLGISHDVLPELPPADVALVDGDHNWFTVYHELKMLADTSAVADRPLPVLVLHDVCWPYGRRDLYYEPSRIPEEHRQPHFQGGMRPGTSRLFHRGGMNLGLDNADHEGGPRNGVMTALDDFMAEHPEPLRRVVLPIYYGLAIVADERTLAQHPALAEILDRLDSHAGQVDLVAMAERIRLDEAIFNQAWIRTLEQQVDRTAQRHLDTVKAALLNEHYLESELRHSYLSSLAGGAVDQGIVRDPTRNMLLRFQLLRRAREAGQALPSAVGDLPYTSMGRTRLDHLEATVRSVVDDGVEGDLVEVGVGRGGGAMFMQAYLRAHEVTDRRVWVVDRFVPNDEPGRIGSDLNQVRDGFDRFGIFDDQVRFLQGAPSDTLPDAPIDAIAVLRLGEDLGEDLAVALEHLHPRMAPGGRVIVAGTGRPAGEAALARARASLGIDEPLRQVDWNAVEWQVPLHAIVRPDEAAPAVTSQAALARPAPVPAVPPGATDLSIVVVFYNMRREAARTLHSLSRSYQRWIEDLDYEVIVIDNGSDPDQRLDQEMVVGFGPEFRFVDLGDDADPSPTVALNKGIAMSRGKALALMIDGAHVLTPGVLHFGMTALRAYEPAVVATQQWYVGPGQQGDSQQSGYDQDAEDRLFRSIGWPIDGYRLFEISHFIGERDWFDGIVESNCLFAPRKLLEQHGGFDDSFHMPGGGYANLDLFERLALAPGVRAASILGEGSFHQVHGGTTTNVSDEAHRRERVVSYGQHFEELRGRRLVGLDRSIHFVGTMATKAARRTRSRRQLSLDFDPISEHNPERPAPLAEELKLAAIEAMWNQEAWRDATWLGHRVNRYPTDLHAYQELLAEQRPPLVVVIGDDPGVAGRALFAASVCERLGTGRVVAVGEHESPDRPEHELITYVDGPAARPDVVEQVTALGPQEPGALVLIGVGGLLQVLGAFEAYAPLVGVGGHVVIENTVVNGWPVAPGFGMGPHEASVTILAQHPEFVVDPAPERYGVTFNRGGFLRRTAAP